MVDPVSFAVVWRCWRRSFYRVSVGASVQHLNTLVSLAVVWRCWRSFYCLGKLCRLGALLLGPVASGPVCALTASSKVQDLSPKVRKCSSLCTYSEHVENFKIFKNEKCAHCRCTDWSMCGKKCDTWAKARERQITFDRPIGTMLMERARLTSVHPSIPSRHGSGPGWRAASPGRPPSLPPLYRLRYPNRCAYCLGKNCRPAIP